MNSIALLQLVDQEFVPQGIGFIIGTIVVVVFLFIWIVASRYTKAGPNEVLVVSGKRNRIKGTKEVVGFRISKGGGVFVWPVLEKVDRMSLELITLDVKTPEVYTSLGVPVLVDGVAQIKVKGDDVSIRTAAEQYLGKGFSEIKNIALQTVEGHLRAILGTMTVEEIYTNRDVFAQKVQEIAAGDMANMGMTLVSFTIRDIRDNEGYLEALGRPRIAQVKRDAEIGEADAKRDAKIRTAQAEQAGETAKFEAETLVAESERDYQMKVAEYTYSVNEKKAEADLAYDLQKFKTQQLVREQEVQVEVIEKEKRIKVQEQEILRREKELNATIQKPAEAEKFRVQTLADAKRYEYETTAKGSAEATKARGFAEADVVAMQGEKQAAADRALGLARADVILAQGQSEAAAMEKKAAAWKDYNQAAVMQMLIDRLPEIASAIAQPLSKTEKIVVINSGGADGGAGASKVTKDVTEIIAQLPEVIDALTGVDLQKLIEAVPALKEAKGGKVDRPAQGRDA